MKTILAVSWSAALIAFSPVLLAQTPAADGPSVFVESEDPDKIIEEMGAMIAANKKAMQERVAVVEAAIETAARNGVLKASTATYYREILGQFKTPDGQIPSAQRAEYPPRTDNREGMEAINLAWANLQKEVSRVQTEYEGVAQRLIASIAEFSRRVARTAEKPEDLAPLQRTLALARKYPDPTRQQQALGVSALDVFARITAAMNEVLSARSKGDTSTVMILLQRLPQTNYTGLSLERYNVPFQASTLIEEFRTRIIRPYSEEVEKSRDEVDKRFLQKRPFKEIEEACVRYETAVRNLDEMHGRATPNERVFGNPRQSPYRTLLEVRRSIEDPENSTTSNISSTNFSAEAFNNPAMLQVAADLRRDLEQHEAERRKAEQEKERVQQQARQAEQRREEAEQQAKIQKEAREVILKSVEKARAILDTVRTPEDALRVADEFPGLMPAFGNQERYMALGDHQNTWRAVERELRQIANVWLEKSGEVDGVAVMDRSAEANASMFVRELRVIRDRAIRESVSARLNAPELLKSPFAEKPVKMAIEALADQSAAAGDWNRCLELLRVLRPTQGGQFPSERMQGIKSFLTGRNYEDSELFAEAVQSYQQVLQQTVPGTPVKEAAARLKELKGSHPDAFGGAKSGRPAMQVTPFVQ